MTIHYAIDSGTVSIQQELHQTIYIFTTPGPITLDVWLNNSKLDLGIDYLFIIGDSKISVKFLENCPINTRDSYYIRWAYL